MASARQLEVVAALRSTIRQQLESTREGRIALILGPKVLEPLIANIVNNAANYLTFDEEDGD